MILLINYADHKMKQSQILCSESALKNGVDQVWTHNPDHISNDFREINNDILSQPRGAGYWLWKPYFIYRALNHPAVKEGDIVIYADAGSEFIDDVRKVINCMEGDIMLFNNGFKHVEWCKADIYELMNRSFIPVNDYFYHLVKKTQCQASFQIYRKSQASIDFVKEWLLYCQMPGFIDDSPSKIPNYPTFAEHRHDQAILTCVAIKHGIELHWCPLTMNMHRLDLKLPGDDYPAIINHHRKRDPGYGDANSPTW